MVRDKLIANAIMLMRHKYEYYSLKQVQRLIKGVEPVSFGTGFKNKEKLVYVVKMMVYKIWEPSYKGSERILQAIEAGFYDSKVAPALVGVILNEEGSCCGYVMRKCRLHITPSVFNTLFKRLCDNSKKSGWMYTDFIEQNVGICTKTKEPTLLDLESVTRIIPSKVSVCRDFSYKNFLKSLTFSSDCV